MKSVSVALIFTISVFMFGCDGKAEDLGGNQPSTLTPVEQVPSVPSSGAQGLNGELTGRLIATYDFEPYEFDLQSGAATKVPIVNTLDYYADRADVGNALRWNYFAAGDGSPNQGFVETLYNCLSLPTGSCISVYDSNYQAVKRVRVPDRVLEEPSKLSPSGRQVLMSYVGGFANETSTILIMDVDSTSIVESTDIDNTASGRGQAPFNPVFEWGHNNEVYYTIPADDRPTVYVTKPGTLEIMRTIRLPQSYSGHINSLDAHPDGSELLMELRAGEGNAFSIIIVLDLDTLDLRIPAVNQADLNTRPIGDDFVSQFVSPMWSPDGRHIMFLNTFTTGVNPIVVPGIDPPTQFMVAVPADSSRVIVNGWQASQAPSLSPAIIIKLQDPDNSGQITTNWRGDTFDDAHVDWIE